MIMTFTLLIMILCQLYLLIDSVKEKKGKFFSIFHLFFYIFILICYWYNNNEIPFDLMPIIAIDISFISIYFSFKNSSVKKS